jgi:hypothetical protein
VTVAGAAGGSLAVVVGSTVSEDGAAGATASMLDGAGGVVAGAASGLPRPITTPSASAVTIAAATRPQSKARGRRASREPATTGNGGSTVGTAAGTGRTRDGAAADFISPRRAATNAGIVGRAARLSSSAADSAAAIAGSSDAIGGGGAAVRAATAPLCRRKGCAPASIS